jgi:hypothetical protein
MLYPYPTEIPMKEVIDLVLQALKGEGDPKETAHAVWQVIGFGLSKWDVHAPVGVALSDEAVVEHLANLGAGGVVQAIPWVLIVPVLIELLKKLLG